MLKLFRFLKPFTVLIIGVLIFVFLQTLGSLYLPTLMSDIIDNGVMQGDTNYIWQVGGFMLLVSAGSIICAILASLLSARAAVGFGAIIRAKVFKKVENYSMHEFDKFGTSTLITRTTNDITQVQNVTIIIMRMMIGAPMMAIGGLILAYSEDKKLTLVLAVAIPVLAIVITILAAKAIPFFRLVQKKVDKINLILREKLTGIRVIRAFDTVKREEERFEEANMDLTQNYIKVNRIMAFMMPSIMLIMNLTALAILWFGIIRINNKGMDIGSLVAFTQYAMQIMFSMLMLSMMFIMVPRAQAAAVRINEVLETVPEIVDEKILLSFSKKDDLGVKSSEEKGHIEFRNVAFSYHGAEEPAIRNISFSAFPGEITAIIGSTGSGKSTLVSLIPRFYDIDDGSILIDGVNIQEMSQEYLRAKIGMVPQKAILFAGSIRDNIKFGNANVSEEELAHVLEVAQATEFVASMDGGLDYEIAQGGTNLSGGQKQRLSIARALIRKPEIYIFDDSFSALDFKTDALLRAALKKEIKDSTVLIVAQRVSTVMDADRIIVMNEGEISGIGTHKELINTCDVYREIVLSQLSEEEIA